MQGEVGKGRRRRSKEAKRKKKRMFDIRSVTARIGKRKYLLL